jgi:hypothetical protein
MNLSAGWTKAWTKEGTYTFIFSKVGKIQVLKHEDRILYVEPLVKKEMGNLTCWFVFGSLP